VKAYICVYRNFHPASSDFKKTKRAIAEHSGLAEYMTRSHQEDAFYDWGDDPSFFAAHQFTGDVRRASWGVCRPNVRANLDTGDIVIFFCAREGKNSRWDYFFIGLGTVGRVVKRDDVWTDESLAPYRNFYNLLARIEDGKLVHSEVFHPYHRDWERRMANYVIFDERPTLTDFNLITPLHVATSVAGKAPEIWHSTELVKNLEQLLFVELGIQRRLRTTNRKYPHPHINLTATLTQENKSESLRAKLILLAQTALDPHLIRV
jgi:hypothetical protein